ncbi:hypothetical protein HWQ46_03785 [Shewanella sp. D64]|uniref:hypothetical protein n=1 Tax=unclassified Shewanella TaxID=196818 RepID=UPI0022BA228E|nr:MULTISPECIES: hypothetical protein [unclassified Shewanella]MEC4724668.1 hypothetical protein [Shewanella sp. D64]MEC4736555.1 hypothetical protein [Shewanella sp. E94]WBJ94768.1 hypothetical protein HWQ47_23425 [Shewanella sp. MTB7]
MSKPTVVIQLDLPAIPIEEYARRSGQPLSHCESQSKTGELPIIQAGRGCRKYVNLIAMAQTCSEAAQWNMKVPAAEYSL